MSRRAEAASTTKDAGFQAGARRTFDLAPDALWRLVISPAGQGLLGGDGKKLGPDSLGIRAFGESHYRRRIPASSGGESLLQVRVIPASRGRSTLALHRELIRDARERAAVLAELGVALDAFAELGKRNGRRS